MAAGGEPQTTMQLEGAWPAAGSSEQGQVSGWQAGAPPHALCSDCGLGGGWELGREGRLRAPSLPGPPQGTSIPSAA